MRFLATVVCVEEALMIVGAVDLLDVKDPSKGSLGAPSVKTVGDIKTAVGLSTPLSVALGDLDGGTVELGLSMAAAGADIIKIGLADTSRKAAIGVFKTLKKNLPPKVRIVAAAYADAEYHRFFPAFGLPSFAIEAKADGILIDTLEKSGRGLFDFLSAYELASIIQEARDLKLMTALAGSLDVGDIEEVAMAAPDFVGFRSAITVSGNRNGHGVDPVKISRLNDHLQKAGKNRKTLSLYK